VLSVFLERAENSQHFRPQLVSTPLKDSRDEVTTGCYIRTATDLWDHDCGRSVSSKARSRGLLEQTFAFGSLRAPLALREPRIYALPTYNFLPEIASPASPSAID
jgi:hypothetical protein